MLLPSYLTEPQMMMMSNTAKKKDNRTPRMICSSLVNRPSTMQVTFKQATDYKKTKFAFNVFGSFKKKITCSFDVLREIGVCRLASNVCSSELKPGEQQSELRFHVDAMPSDSCLLALTRIRCLASKVRCISDCCCSLSRSHRSRR